MRLLLVILAALTACELEGYEMKRIDTPRAANAYGGAAGGTGHFQETDPAGATQLDAMWFEGFQEEVAGLIEGYGGTLTGDQTTNLYATVDGVLGGARGIKSAVADTGVVTNTHTALVIGSDTSRANAQSAVVIASSGQTNSEVYSVKGGTGGTAKFALRSGEGVQAALLKVGGDVDAGTGETVRVSGATGDVHAEGDVRVGGDATAGTGATATLDASGGRLDLAYDGTTVAAYDAGINWTATNNYAHGTVALGNANNVAWATGSAMTVALTNNKIVDGDTTIIAMVYAVGAPLDHIVATMSSCAAGSATITFWNLGTAAIQADAWAMSFNFVVIGAL